MLKITEQIANQLIYYVQFISQSLHVTVIWRFSKSLAGFEPTSVRGKFLDDHSVLVKMPEKVSVCHTSLEICSCKK
jgi:hypothetical protein